MMRAPPFIRRWLEAKALGRKQGRIRPLGREDERANEFNRAQRELRESGSTGSEHSEASPAGSQAGGCPRWRLKPRKER